MPYQVPQLDLWVTRYLVYIIGDRLGDNILFNVLVYLQLRYLFVIIVSLPYYHSISHGYHSLKRVIKTYELLDAISLFLKKDVSFFFTKYWFFLIPALFDMLACFTTPIWMPGDFYGTFDCCQVIGSSLSPPGHFRPTLGTTIAGPWAVSVQSGPHLANYTAR